MKIGGLEGLSRQMARGPVGLSGLARAARLSLLLLGLTAGQSAWAYQPAGTDKTPPPGPATAKPVLPVVPPSASGEKLPDFGWWPNYGPSSRINLPQARIRKQLKAGPSLMDVGAFLITGLYQADYREISLYNTANGFVIVTRMECVDASGSRDTDRFCSFEAQKVAKNEGVIRKLFFEPENVRQIYHRQIVFMVTNKVLVPGDGALTSNVTRDMLRKGGNKLPGAYSAMPFSNDYEITALIYEYGTPASAAPLMTDGIPDAQSHLRKSGVYAALGIE